MSMKGFGAKESTGQEALRKALGQRAAKPGKGGQMEGRRGRKGEDSEHRKQKRILLSSKMTRVLNSQVLKTDEDSLKARNHSSTWDQSVLCTDPELLCGEMPRPKGKRNKRFKKVEFRDRVRICGKTKGKISQGTWHQGKFVLPQYPVTRLPTPCKRKRISKATAILPLTTWQGERRCWVIKDKIHK